MTSADVTIRNVSIGLGILILLPLAVNVGIDLVNPLPDREQFTTTMPKTRYSSKEESVINQEAYDAAIQTYRKNYFYISTVFGLASIVIGTFISVPFLGTGFILGGVVCLTFGYVMYWNMIHKAIKFISLLLAIAFLVFMGYRLSARRRQD